MPPIIRSGGINILFCYFLFDFNNWTLRCQGFPACSIWALLKAIGLCGNTRKRAVRSLGKEAEKTSAWIWDLRDIKEWKSHEHIIILSVGLPAEGCHGFEGWKHPVTVGNHLMML